MALRFAGPGRLYSSGRGFSLIEIVLVSVLLVLMMTLAFNFLIPALRMSALGMLRISMEQEALTSLSRIASDVQMSVPKGITISYSNPALVASNHYKMGADGQIADGAAAVNWEKEFHIAYLDTGSRELRSRVWSSNPAGGADPPLPPSLDSTLSPKRIPATLLPAICSDAGVCRRLARDVSEFRLEPGGAEKELRQPLKFTLVLIREGGTGRTQAEKVTFSRTVFLAGSQ